MNTFGNLKSKVVGFLFFLVLFIWKTRIWAVSLFTNLSLTWQKNSQLIHLRVKLYLHCIFWKKTRFQLFLQFNTAVVCAWKGICDKCVKVKTSTIKDILLPYNDGQLDNIYVYILWDMQRNMDTVSSIKSALSDSLQTLYLYIISFFFIFIFNHCNPCSALHTYFLIWTINETFI